MKVQVWRSAAGSRRSVCLLTNAIGQRGGTGRGGTAGRSGTDRRFRAPSHRRRQKAARRRRSGRRWVTDDVIRGWSGRVAIMVPSVIGLEYYTHRGVSPGTFADVQTAISHIRYQMAAE